jgi:hypothetical protein
VSVPPRPERVAVLGQTVFEVWPYGCRAILPDGAEAQGAPQDTAEYRARAAALGYGGDTLSSCRDHDLLHAALCAWLGLPESPVLRHSAEGRGASDLTNLEEDAVLAVQRFARAAGIDLSRRFVP